MRQNTQLILSSRLLMKIISIVTGLPPKIDGVGDYAVNLAKGLWQDFSIDTNFISLGKNPKKVEEFYADDLASRTSSSLDLLLDNVNPRDSIILLHYASRSYGYKGCPFWLLNSLKKYKARGGKIAIMFHEIYAQDSPIMSSDFWLAPIQKKVVKSLIDLADQCFTNCDDYAICIQRLLQPFHHKLVVLPVPSSVGEPEYYKPLIERERRLIIFGQGGNKMRAYKAASEISKACNMLDIKEIWDIGPSGEVPKSVSKFPVICLGKRSSKEISEILMNSVAGLLSYHHARLGKSSIFSSYCAHGILPINVGYQSAPVLRSDQEQELEVKSEFKLIPGEHYLAVDSSQDIFESSIYEFQKIANRANSWYKTHDLSIQPRIFSEYLSRLL
jgi:hypothetical protein